MPYVCGRANQFVTKLLTLPAKAFIGHVKTRSAQTSFTLCLPGSPKVTLAAHVALGCRGVSGLRISAFRDRIEGTGGLFRREVLITQPGTTETSFGPGSQYLRAQR